MGNLLAKRDTDFVRDNMLINYCLNDDDELLIESFVRNNNLDIRFNPKHFYFFMTGAHNKYTASRTPEGHDLVVSRILQLYEVFENALRAHGYDGNPFLVKVDNSKQLSLIFSEKSKPLCTPDEMAQKLFELYYQANDPYLISPDHTFSSTSFVGPYMGYEQIHLAFREARKLNDLYFFGIRDQVITPKFRSQTARPCSITAILANVRRLTSTLCTGTMRMALSQIDYLIDHMVAPSYSSLNFTTLCTAIEDVLSMFMLVYPDQISIELREIKFFFTLGQYKKWLHETIRTLYAQLASVRRYSPTILMALSFINQNFATDLSLTQLSEYAYANPSSLSSEFNAEVGMSLSEYITALRIQKAQQLLRESDMTIPHIAQQAGFSSAKYFREIFKRQTGLSPQQYRNK